MNNRPGAIVVDRLTVQRGPRKVLDGLCLAVAAGQVVGLLGPSGSGKSTLLRAIVGVQRISGGSVTVLGCPAGSLPLRHRVGYVTQTASVYDDLTVGENLAYFAHVVGAPGADVARVVEETDLRAQVGQQVAHLSGGQRNRVSLAAALLGQPEVLILDEPTVGLDPVLRRDLWNLFHRLAASGISLLVSSHVMDEATRCDRLLLLREGQLVADESLDALLAQTGQPDPESAFLTLITRRESTSSPHPARHSGEGPS